LVQGLIFLHFRAETFNPLTMDSKIILEAAHGTLDGSLSFPEVVGKLLAAGVKYYHVDWRDWPAGRQDLRFTIADLRLKRKFSRISRFEIRVHSCNPCQTSAS
jgi:hypothetical protein